VAAGEAVFDRQDEEGNWIKVPGSEKSRVDAAKTLLDRIMPSLKSTEKTVEVGDNLAGILAAAEQRVARLAAPEAPVIEARVVHETGEGEGE
jgi:hypothetical protein